jgi:hypothetical protein
MKCKLKCRYSHKAVIITYSVVKWVSSSVSGYNTTAGFCDMVKMNVLNALASLETLQVLEDSSAILDE